MWKAFFESRATSLGGAVHSPIGTTAQGERRVQSVRG